VILGERGLSRGDGKKCAGYVVRYNYIHFIGSNYLNRIDLPPENNLDGINL